MWRVTRGGKTTGWGQVEEHLNSGGEAIRGHGVGNRQNIKVEVEALERQAGGVFMRLDAPPKHPKRRRATDAASEMDYTTSTCIIPRHIARLLTSTPIPLHKREGGLPQSEHVGECARMPMRSRALMSSVQDHERLTVS